MIKIYADHRESRSPVFKILDTMGADLKVAELMVGDFILSDRIGVERKTAPDALSSFIGEEKGKIMRQCYDLARAYQRPILFLECDLPDLFSRNIHPGAIWGLLRSIIWKKCAIEFTYNAEGTAKRLYELAKQEQDGNKKDFSPHGSKTKRTNKEQIEYTTSSIPALGPGVSKNLLHKFGTIQAIANAETTELETVKLIGEKTANEVFQFFRRDWNKER